MTGNQIFFVQPYAILEITACFNGSMARKDDLLCFHPMIVMRPTSALRRPLPSILDELLCNHCQLATHPVLQDINEPGDLSVDELAR